MKVTVIKEGKWSKGQVLNLPPDFAESLISQGIVEQDKPIETNVKNDKKNKPKGDLNNTSGSEGVVEGDEQ